MGLRLRHATACSSRTPSLAKMSAALSVPSTSLSVSSSLSKPVGRLPQICPHHVRRVQVPSGLQSGVHGAKVHLQQFEDGACYELPHSDEGEFRGLGAGAWRTLRTLVTRADIAESWMSDQTLPDHHRQDCAQLGLFDPTWYRLRPVVGFGWNLFRNVIHFSGLFCRPSWTEKAHLSKISDKSILIPFPIVAAVEVAVCAHAGLSASISLGIWFLLWEKHAFQRYYSLLRRQDVVWTGRTSVALLADEDRAVWSRFSRGHR